jgi:hypothetical protein
MRIDCYNFFFHPLDQGHSTAVKAIAVITAVALAALTLGLYLLVFTCVHCNESYAQPSKQDPAVTRAVSPILSQPAVGLTPLQHHLKEKQSDHLQKLKKLPWKDLQTHTSHPDSGFDWWMFPIDRASQGYGDEYQVSQADIAALKADPEFMKSYREGVVLVAKSWGWDLETGYDVSNEEQYWTNYQVRLGKMLNSLTLFSQEDLHAALVECIDRAQLRSTLADWIQKYL